MQSFAFDEPTPQADRRRLEAVRQPPPCARTRHHLDGGVPDSRAPQPGLDRGASDVTARRPAPTNVVP